MTKIQNNIKKFTVLFVAICLIISGSFLINKQDEARPTLTVADNELLIEVANTNDARVLGLSGRDSLPEDEAMLFVFTIPAEHGIWMKDMQFPIDIFWINENKQIVYIETDVNPDTFPQSFAPDEPALYVLETNAGFADENSITIGDSVQF